MVISGDDARACNSCGKRSEKFVLCGLAPTDVAIVECVVERGERIEISFHVQGRGL